MQLLFPRATKSETEPEPTPQAVELEARIQEAIVSYAQLRDQVTEMVRRAEDINRLIQDQTKELMRIQRGVRSQFGGMSWKRRLRHAFKILWGIRVGTLWQYPSRPLHYPRRYSAVPTLVDPPTISIVTPSFNQAEYLERTMHSVLGQQYPRLQYVVQDGGSTDDTPQLLERFASQLTHVESRKDNGQAHAINLGFEHCNGEIMAYLNSDDILCPGALHHVAEFFQSHPEVDAVYGNRILIDESDGEVGRWVLPRHDAEVLRWADFVPQETLFWRRRIWDKCGSHMDESFRFALDWDLLLRFQDTGGQLKRTKRFLGAFRLHSQQKTMQQLADVGEKEMRRLRRRCHGRDVTHTEVSKAIRPYLLRQGVYHRLYTLGLIRC